MEKNPVSPSQVFAVAKIEYLISVFYNDPDNFFEQIIKLAEEQKIAEHEETMIYFYELFISKGYLEYAKKFADKYAIQTEKNLMMYKGIPSVKKRLRIKSK